MHSATCVFRWTEADTMHLYRNTFIFHCSGDKAAKNPEKYKKIRKINETPLDKFIYFSIIKSRTNVCSAKI